MSERWSFHFRYDGFVVFRPTVTPTASDGTIGDAEDRIGPGEDALGIPYADLVAAGSGVIEVSDDGQSARIVGAGDARP